jgi:hypothetical protein
MRRRRQDAVNAASSKVSSARVDLESAQIAGPKGVSDPQPKKQVFYRYR